MTQDPKDAQYSLSDESCSLWSYGTLHMNSTTDFALVLTRLGPN